MKTDLKKERTLHIAEFFLLCGNTTFHALIFIENISTAHGLGIKVEHPRQRTCRSGCSVVFGKFVKANGRASLKIFSYSKMFFSCIFCHNFI